MPYNHCYHSNIYKLLLVLFTSMRHIVYSLLSYSIDVVYSLGDSQHTPHNNNAAVCLLFRCCFNDANRHIFRVSFLFVILDKEEISHLFRQTVDQIAPGLCISYITNKSLGFIDSLNILTNRFVRTTEIISCHHFFLISFLIFLVYLRAFDLNNE